MLLCYIYKCFIKFLKAIMALQRASREMLREALLRAKFAGRVAELLVMIS